MAQYRSESQPARLASYGAPNPVYQGNNNPMINTGQNQMQGKNPGMFEGWGKSKYLLGPGTWLAEYMNPGMSNKLWEGSGAGDAWNWLKEQSTGKPAYNEQVSTVTPEVQQALSQMLQYGLNGMNSNQFDWAPIEQQARSNFAQNTMPSIAERFTQLGGGNSLGSGSRQRMMAGAQAGLEENLAAMKSQYNLQREPLMQNYMRMGMMPQFENQYHQEDPGMLKSLLGQLIPAAAQMGTAYLTGGASLIPQAASAFSSFMDRKPNTGMWGQQGSFKPQGFGYQYS